MDTIQACQILQIRPDSTFTEIKYAYRKLALELHPDKNNEEHDGAKFRKVTEAYHHLKNSAKATNSKLKEKAWRPSGAKARSNWGARPEDRTPEEDWSRYTQQVEESNPTFWRSYVAEFWKGYEERVGQAKRQYDFEIIQEMKKEADLHVGVDHSLCIGCCSCETIAPKVFSVDKISKMNPKSNVVNKKGAKVDTIMDAAQTCPTKAIKVEDAETGRRLYPY